MLYYGFKCDGCGYSEDDKDDLSHATLYFEVHVLSRFIPGQFLSADGNDIVEQKGKFELCKECIKLVKLPQECI